MKRKIVICAALGVSLMAHSDAFAKSSAHSNAGQSKFMRFSPLAQAGFKDLRTRKPSRKIASAIPDEEEQAREIIDGLEAGAFEMMEIGNLCGDDAPATTPPPAPTPAPVPSPGSTTPATWKNCTQITVHCFDPLNPPAELRRGSGAICIDCHMYLPNSTCRVIGYTDGQLLPKNDIKKKHDEWKNYQPSPSRRYVPYDIVSYCQAIHENEHEYDYNFGPKLRSCKTELNAYAIQISCMEHYYAMGCTGAPGYLWDAAACQTLKDEIDAAKIHRSYNECICGKTCPAGSLGCAACKAACLVTNPGNLNCDLADRVYCKEFTPSQCP